MTIEKQSGIGSRCRCDLFSCGAAVKTVENVNVYDPDRRYRFIKNEEGAICDGGVVSGGIDSCQIRIDRRNGVTKPADVPVARQKKVESLIEYKNKRIAKINSEDKCKTKIKTKGSHIPSLNVIDLDLKAKLARDKKKKLARSENNYYNVHHRYPLSRI